MRLADLNPKWFAIVGRAGQGVTFDCPCPECCYHPEKRVRLSVAFAQPLDGGERIELGVTTVRAIYDSGSNERGKCAVPPGVHWHRTGDTFETMTLFPSLDFSASGHWHGFLRSGEVTSC